MEWATIILGHVRHLVLLHFDIGRDLGSKLLTLIQILGVGFTLGGLENFNGLLGSESVTLLRTKMFESVLFFLYAIIGLLGNIWFNNVSLSMSGQYVFKMSDFVTDLAKFNR